MDDSAGVYAKGGDEQQKKRGAAATGDVNRAVYFDVVREHRQRRSGSNDPCDRIRESVATLLESLPFRSWVEAHKLSEGSIVGINNSSVFRHQLKTTKNPYVLCVNADNKGELSPKDTGIATGTPFNTDFKLFSAKAGNLPTVETLEAGVDRELRRFGKLIFVLIGHIEDNIRLSQPINYALFDQVTLDPGQRELLRLEGRTIIVRDTFDEEALWTEMEKQCVAARLIVGALPDDLREPFAVALDALSSEAYAALKLPDAKGRQTGSALLDAMVGVLDQHAAEYAKSLHKCSGDPQRNATEFNNILRIAYNFSSDATKVIRLLVSVCDLKPLLFWCTLAEWFRLSDCFKNLPWAKSKNKPSLGAYQETISAARNRAFHNIFPFNKALEAKLEGISLEAIKLRIFSEHKGKKSQNIFDFEDKALVEILTEFTRAGEKFVPPLFWQRNLEVMTAAVALLSSVSTTLKLLAPHILTPSRGT